MDNKQEQLQQPLNYVYHDPEAGTSNPNDPPKPFNEPKPEVGYEFVPPEGTVPQAMMASLAFAMMRKIEEASSKYEGEKDGSGHKHGKGRIVYIDGSSYDGTWQNDHKHGYGVETLKDGTVYKGEYVMGLKEGKGELILANGDRILATWVKDKKNGVGQHISGDKTHECIFDNDLEIRLADQNPDCYNLMPLNLILVLIAGICFSFGTSTAMGFGVLFYLIQLCETCCGRTMSFLSHVEPQDHITKHINEQRVRPAIIEYIIQNYHYEVHHRHHNGRTEIHHERVNTHSARAPYRYGQWVDQSPDASSIDFIKKSKLCRLNFELDVHYTPQASQSYACQEHDFKHHNIRDTHHDFSVNKTIDGFESNVLMLNMESLPWYANKSTYWVFTILGFAWLYRIIFVSNSNRVQYTFHKLIIA